MAFTRLLLICLSLLFSSSLWAVAVTYNMAGNPIFGLTAKVEGDKRSIELKGSKVKEPGDSTKAGKDSEEQKDGVENKNDDDDDKGQGGGASKRKTFEKAEHFHLSITPVEGQPNQLLVTDLESGHQIFLHHENQDDNNHFNFDAFHTALQNEQLVDGQIPPSIHFMLGVFMSDALLQVAQTALSHSPVSQHACARLSDPGYGHPAALARATWHYSGTWPDAATVPLLMSTEGGITTNVGGMNHVSFEVPEGHTQINVNLTEPTEAAEGGQEPAAENEPVADGDDESKDKEGADGVIADGTDEDEGNQSTDDSKGLQTKAGIQEVSVLPASHAPAAPPATQNPLQTAQVTVTLPGGIAASSQQLGPNSDGTVGGGGSGRSGSLFTSPFSRGDSSSSSRTSDSGDSAGTEGQKDTSKEKTENIEGMQTLSTDLNNAAENYLYDLGKALVTFYALIYMMELPEEEAADYCGMSGKYTF